MPNLPNDELVAIAWIGSIPNFTASIVATQLPETANKDGTPAAWVITPPKGFVTVSVVGGGEDDNLPIYRPVMQVDCWATNPGSHNPPSYPPSNPTHATHRATPHQPPTNPT